MTNEHFVTSDYMTAIRAIAEHDPRKARYFESLVDLDNAVFGSMSSKILKKYGNTAEGKSRMQELREHSYEKIIDRYINEYMIENGLGEYISEDEYVKRFGEEAYRKQFKES